VSGKTNLTAYASTIVTFLYRRFSSGYWAYNFNLVNIEARVNKNNKHRKNIGFFAAYLIFHD